MAAVAVSDRLRMSSRARSVIGNHHRSAGDGSSSVEVAELVASSNRQRSR